jgi:hypothetical protein
MDQKFFTSVRNIRWILKGDIIQSLIVHDYLFLHHRVNMSIPVKSARLFFKKA